MAVYTYLQFIYDMTDRGKKLPIPVSNHYGMWWCVRSIESVVRTMQEKLVEKTSHMDFTWIIRFWLPFHAEFTESKTQWSDPSVRRLIVGLKRATYFYINDDESTEWWMWLREILMNDSDRRSCSWSRIFNLDRSCLITNMNLIHGSHEFAIPSLDKLVSFQSTFHINWVWL